MTASTDTDPAAVISAIVDEIAQMHVAPDQSFFDIGLDSMQLLDICTKVVERYGEVIDLFRLFENASVGELAAIVRQAQTTAS